MKLFDFSNMSMEQQILLSIMFPVAPLVVGQLFFFVLLIFGILDIVYSLFVSFMFVMGGEFLWLLYRDKTRRDVMGMTPINAINRWSKSIITAENSMVLHRDDIRSDKILKPVRMEGMKPIFDKEIRVEVFEKVYDTQRRREVFKKVQKVFTPNEVQIGLWDIALTPEIQNKIIAGKFATEIVMPRRSIAPNGVPYRRIQYIHAFPHQDDFHSCPDQFVVHNAQLISCPSSVIDAHFLFWGERDEPIPVFLIASSPQWTELIQQSIGMKPLLSNSDQDSNEANVGVELRRQIESTMILADTNVAMTYAQLLQARNRQLEGMMEDKKDAVDIGIQLHGEWKSDMDEIKKMRGFDWKKEWWKLLGLGLAFILLLVLMWLLFLPPTQAPAA